MDAAEKKVKPKKMRSVFPRYPPFKPSGNLPFLRFIYITMMDIYGFIFLLIDFGFFVGNYITVVAFITQ